MDVDASRFGCGEDRRGQDQAVSRDHRQIGIERRESCLFVAVAQGARSSHCYAQRFRAFVDRIEDVPMSPILQGGTETELSPEVLAGYEKPFPNPSSKAGARAFPGLIAQTPDHPAAAAGRRVLDALRTDERDKLLLWATGDLVLPPALGDAFAAALGAETPTPVADAGHFLQEDKGAEIGALIADWLGG